MILLDRPKKKLVPSQNAVVGSAAPYELLSMAKKRSSMANNQRKCKVFFAQSKTFSSNIVGWVEARNPTAD